MATTQMISSLIQQQLTHKPEKSQHPDLREVVDDQKPKLYPFKYKTATQPLTSSENQLIALDTSVYFSSGEADAATRSGLNNRDTLKNTPYEWI